MSNSLDNPIILNKFLRLLGRNKMGDSFCRIVSSSLQKRTLPRGLSERRYQKTNQKQGKNQRIKTLPSQKKKQIQANQTVTSFIINEKPLGQSIRLIQHASQPSSTQQQSLLRTRQLTFRDRMQMSKISAFGLDLHGIETQQFFKKRQQLINNNQIGEILVTLTGNPNKDKLRIYKDRMKKFYSIRYVRQKLTSFFDYQYIEDYDSQLGYLQTLLSLNLQEIQFLCFITMDINCDGLVCNDDLFTLATVSSEENALVNKDIFKIFQYISTYQNSRTNISIIDMPADDQPAKDPACTLQKYRLTILKMDKNTNNDSYSKEKGSFKKSIKLINKPDHKEIILTRKINRHLFSLKSQEEQGQAAIRQLRKRFAQYSLQSRSYYKFKINFQRYQNIFRNTIPQTYFDLLFVQGGIKIQGKAYCPLNFQLEQVQKKEVVKIDIDRYQFYTSTIGKMRETYRKSRIQKFNSQRYRRVNKSK